MKREFYKDNKKRNIIIAALEVFAQKGFNSATIKEIADKAGIGKGTIYEYFKSKNEIILSAFSVFIEEGEASLSALENLPYPPDKKLLKGLEIFTEVINREGISNFELFFDFWSVGIKEKKYKSEFYNQLKNFYSKYRQTFAKIIKEGQNKGIFSNKFSAEIIGAMIIGMLDGLMAQWILDEKSIDYSEAVKTMGKIIIEGLRFKGGLNVNKK